MYPNSTRSAVVVFSYRVPLAHFLERAPFHPQPAGGLYLRHQLRGGYDLYQRRGVWANRPCDAFRALRPVGLQPLRGFCHRFCGRRRLRWRCLLPLGRPLAREAERGVEDPPCAGAPPGEAGHADADTDAASPPPHSPVRPSPGWRRRACPRGREQRGDHQREQDPAHRGAGQARERAQPQRGRRQEQHRNDVHRQRQPEHLLCVQPGGPARCRWVRRPRGGCEGEHRRRGAHDRLVGGLAPATAAGAPPPFPASRGALVVPAAIAAMLAFTSASVALYAASLS